MEEQSQHQYLIIVKDQDRLLCLTLKMLKRGPQHQQTCIKVGTFKWMNAATIFKFWFTCKIDELTLI